MGFARALAACVLALLPVASAQQAQTADPDLLKGLTLTGVRVIPSEQMTPNLLVGDRVAEVAIDRELRRGDVVLYRHPNNNRLVMITRIIGIPGDTVQVKGGRLILNGKLVERKFVREVTYVPDDMDRSVTVVAYDEQLPGAERPIRIFEYGDTDPLDETPEFRVPAGHFFMLGDNRDNSEDSRAPSGHRALVAAQPDGWPLRGAYLPADTRDDAIGFVPAANMIGRAVTVIFTLNSCRASAEMKAAGAECLQSGVGRPL
jgi:signal peptidase I